MRGRLLARHGGSEPLPPWLPAAAVAAGRPPAVAAAGASGGKAGPETGTAAHAACVISESCTLAAQDRYAPAQYAPQSTAALHCQ
jgi:hypothetical protein